MSYHCKRNLKYAEKLRFHSVSTLQNSLENPWSPLHLLQKNQTWCKNSKYFLKDSKSTFRSRVKSSTEINGQRPKIMGSKQQTQKDLMNNLLTQAFWAGLLWEKEKGSEFLIDISVYFLAYTYLTNKHHGSYVKLFLSYLIFCTGNVPL